MPPRGTGPDLWALHHNAEADWRRILAGHPEQAAAWIRFAAERGFKAAQVVLGQMHLDGHGTPRDADAAYDWFARAARIGSVEARNMLGRCHEYGWGTPVDHAAALDHYARAAAAGHAWAGYNLGCLRLYGDVPRRHAEAFARFTAAAHGPNPEARAKALGMLGRCHEEGWGTPVDGMAARRCYRAASEAGDCWGALNLGLLTLEGEGSAAALPQLERALTLSTPASRPAVARALAGHPEPAVASLGRSAHVGAGPAPKGQPANLIVYMAAHRGGVATIGVDFRTVALLSTALLGATVIRRIREKCRPSPFAQVKPVYRLERGLAPFFGQLPARNRSVSFRPSCVLPSRRCAHNRPFGLAPEAAFRRKPSEWPLGDRQLPLMCRLPGRRTRLCQLGTYIHLRLIWQVPARSPTAPHDWEMPFGVT